MQAVNVGSAIEVLKAMVPKKPDPVQIQISQISGDPALRNAQREKNVVKLGMDPSIEERAAYAAELKVALEKAQSDFEAVQGDLRQYGKDKRKAYNDAFKANITTVAVPYEDNGDTRHVQVICTNRYTVQKDVILNNKETLGQDFDRLFNVETTKRLKADGESLLRKLLVEVGISPESTDAVINQLVETDYKVSAVEDYEQKVDSVVNPAAKDVLSQAVSRVSPALKFVG